MSHPDLKDLLACATAASHEACAHAMGNLHRRREADAVFQHDVKLALDRECQEKAEAVIRRMFPQHEILGEESATHEKRKGLCWVIDPIDGTVNFSHGLRFWCNSIACQIDGRTVAAVVQAPALGELYTATLERPSELNGERIAVSTVNELAGALALTGLAKSYGGDNTAFDFLRTVGPRVRKIRLMGAAALDTCQVAAGRVECFFESEINLWDIAAGDLIVKQAGGKTTVLEQLTDLKMRYFASNGRVHAELAEVLDGVLRKMKG